MIKKQNKKIPPNFFLVTSLWVLLPKEYLVTSVLGAQIKKKLWVWYSHNILLMIKMSNRNIIHVGLRQQVWVSWSAGSPLIVNMENRLSFCECLLFLFRYYNDDLSNHKNQRYKHRKFTREDNKHAFHRYFRTNPTQRDSRKRRIEI